MKDFAYIILGIMIGFFIWSPIISSTSSNDDKELIMLQDSMINELINHLEIEHNCDIPVMDGDLYDNINSYKLKTKQK